MEQPVVGNSGMVVALEKREKMVPNTSFFEYVTATVEDQREKSAMLGDVALNFGYKYLEKLKKKFDGQEEGKTNYKDFERLVRVADVFLKMAERLKVISDKERAGKLKQVYEEEEGVLNHAISEVRRLEKEGFRVEDRKEAKDGED